MKRVLPPGLNEQQYAQARVALRAAIGDDWVLDEDGDRNAYADLYAPGPQQAWPLSCALAPANTEEVQAVVQIANRFGIPLWPVSRGKNLGYGHAAPRLAGSMVLDLGRMKQIHEINTELGYAVIEPGVSFYDLYEALQRMGMPLWTSVAGNGWGSVLGNALDHGVGYTPYGNHARQLCGLEAILPSGERMRTGLGGMTDNHAAHVFPLSYGPDWTQMLTQSSLGVVTRAGVWLMPAPETSLQLSLDIPNEADIGWVVDTLSPLRVSGLIDQNTSVHSWIGGLAPLGVRRDFWDQPGAIPEWRIRELIKQYKLGYWHVDVRLYGDEGVNRARGEVIKKAFGRHLSTPMTEQWWRQGDPVNPYDLSMGVPSSVSLQMGQWVGGRSAHLGFSPVVPATSQHVVDQLRRSRRIIAAYDVDFYADFLFGGRFCNNINMLMFDRDKPDEVDKMRRLFSQLVSETAAAGYAEYRTHLGWMDAVADTFDFNNHIQRRLNELVKDAIDPKGIIAPGKQGVWPTRFRDLKQQGQVS